MSSISEDKDKVTIGGVTLRKRRFDVNTVPSAPTARPTTKKLSVFLCHASEDKPFVRELRRKLSDEGVDPWLDEERILPGQNWKQAISAAMSAADVILICLSNRSISKTGFVQKEMKDALKLAELQPIGEIYLIPARLDECDVLQQLGDLQHVDLYAPNGFGQLMKALTQRGEILKIGRIE
jgi:TIR domain